MSGRTVGRWIAASDLVPVAHRSWLEQDEGFRKLFELLDGAGPAAALRQEKAAEVGLRSLSRFKTEFKELTGCPWGAFRREWRLREAHRLLQAPFSRPKEARCAVGWRSRQHFAGAFVARFGVLPREVRADGQTDSE